jgi:CrcB protein
MTTPDDPLDLTPIHRIGFSPAALVAIALGGALGTLARYLLDTAHPTPTGHFPLTTLVINLTGSLGIGIMIPIAERLSSRVPLLRPFVIIGLLGGWTTYSTLAVDATLLMKGGHVPLSLGYLGATVIGGVALVVVGDRLGRRLATS